MGADVRRRLLMLGLLGLLAVELGSGVAPVRSAAVPQRPTDLAATALPAADVVVEAPVEARAPRVVDDAVAPAPDPTRAPLPSEVDLVRPDLRLDGVDASVLDTLRAVDGVADVVAVGTLTTAPVAADAEPVSTLVVDPIAFRRFTPDVTANAVGVWERLREGNVVLTAPTADRLGATLGEPTTLAGPTATESVRVGALAANGLPPLADAVVSWEVGRLLGAEEPDTVLMAVDDDADLDAVRAAVTAATGTEAALLEEPVERELTPTPVGSTALEAFSYQSVGDGTIRIDPGWVARNIVSADMPILGRVTCHRVIIQQMHAALAEIEAAGLAGAITNYDGCHVARHMLWDPSRAISNHAWGTAFDINAATNGYGATPTLDMRVVEIFRKWGFDWGGDFSTPDGMHFELDRIIQF